MLFIAERQNQKNKTSLGDELIACLKKYIED
jgi:hypothetical protein